MSSPQAPRVVFQQSLANRPDVALVKKLIAGYPGLESLRQTRVMAGGYSGARVYLALAQLPATAPAHWVLKVGDGEDLAAEAAAYDLAKASLAGEVAVQKVCFERDGQDALLVYNFAGLNGAPPLDLEQGLRDYASTELFASTLKLVSQWIAQPAWKHAHITKQIQAWSKPKLAHLPDDLAELLDTKTLYYPDVGEALANPGYYIHRGALPRIEANVPFAFTHGDLNLRNILFPTDQQGNPDPDNPRVIDFRHSGTEQWAVVDLARLESCLRHQFIAEPTNHAELAQHIAFMDASSAQLRLQRPPELLRGNNQLQELWRHISALREVVEGICKDEASLQAFWGTLVSYAISFASYADRLHYAKRLAYLDAARILTRYFVRPDLKGSQRTVPLQSGLSANVQGSLQPNSWSAAALVGRFISRGDATLVVGPRFGRIAGVEPLPTFLQNLHKDLARSPPPTTSVKVLLASLDKTGAQPAVVSAIKNRVAKWSLPEEVSQIKKARWAAVIQLHYHNFVRAALLEGPGSVIAVEEDRDVLCALEELTELSTLYFPFYGDVDSPGRCYPFSPLDVERKLLLVEKAMETVRRRLRPLCLVFWRCEDIVLEFFMELRLRMGGGETLDAYYLSDENNPEREEALASIGIVPIRVRLEELASGAWSGNEGHSASDMRSIWRRGEIVYRLPDVKHQTSGLLSLFADAQAVNLPGTANANFLLGAPPTASDIDDGRVLRRSVVDDELVPAIQAGMVRNRDRVRWVFVEGRPGAGVSTCLCLAAHQLTVRETLPVFVISRTEGAEAKTWRLAGELLGEVANQVKRPVVAFLDSPELDGRLLDCLAEGLLDRRGELILVLGGRRSAIHELKRQLNLNSASSVLIPDKLHEQEWQSLAKIVKSEGYSSQLTENELADRMRRVGLLLPAIYEGTDRQNRKFKQIVAHEYGKYSRDQLVQRAYRLICAAGCYGVSLNQYWLLKAVGGAGIDQAPRILRALSGDIVEERALDEGRPKGDLALAPRHRLIAEAVLEIAVPDPEHRLADLRTLIASANLAAKVEGGAVARLLMRNSEFRNWLRETFGHARARREASLLFNMLLERSGLHSSVEITLRHHYSLTLRALRDHEAAVEQAKKAYDLDPTNAASAHVLGLAHEAKALDGWRKAFAADDTHAFARARVDEEEASAFFRQSRDQQPHEEYGYESEARYLRRKAELFSEPRNRNRMPQELAADGTTALARGLRLLHEAETRVHRDSLVETPMTKAKLLSQIGDFDDAWTLLQQSIAAAEDSVSQNRMRELAASLAATHQRWRQVQQETRTLIESGVRSPYVYLMLDDALTALGLPHERRRWAAESANEWNQDDVEVLLRWAGILAEAQDWQAAERVLERAQRAAQRLGLSIAAQLRKRGIARSSNGQVLRVRGHVSRLFRPYEGIIQPVGSARGVGIYFRNPEQASPPIEIGDEVEFSISWRLRGLRADDLQRLNNDDVG